MRVSGAKMANFTVASSHISKAGPTYDLKSLLDIQSVVNLILSFTFTSATKTTQHHVLRSYDSCMLDATFIYSVSLA